MATDPIKIVLIKLITLMRLIVTVSEGMGAEDKNNFDSELTKLEIQIRKLHL